MVFHHNDYYYDKEFHFQKQLFYTNVNSDNLNHKQ